MNADKGGRISVVSHHPLSVVLSGAEGFETLLSRAFSAGRLFKFPNLGLASSP